MIGTCFVIAGIASTPLIILAQRSDRSHGFNESPVKYILGAIACTILFIAIGWIKLRNADQKVRGESASPRVGVNSRGGATSDADLLADDPSQSNVSFADVDTVLDRWAETTSLPCLRVEMTGGPTGVFDSKFGGKPYLPPGFDYPVNTNPHTEHKPLKLLAQLNFGHLPRLPGFPTQGILQFYIANQEDEDTFGLDLDNLTQQSAFRVVYHSDVIEDESRLLEPPPETHASYYFPLEKDSRIEVTMATQPMPSTDFRFDVAFMDAYRQVIPTQAAASFDLPEAVIEHIDEVLRVKSTGHRIGGYPFFTQTDPREDDETLRDHTVMLLQIDSDDEVCWGDVGVANFFITPDALARRDFSNVIYTWDCT